MSMVSSSFTVNSSLSLERSPRNFHRRSLIRRRFGPRKDMYCQECKRSTLFDDPPGATEQFREQYINNNSPTNNQPRMNSFFDRDASSLTQPMLSPSGFTSPSLLSSRITSFYTPSTINLPLETLPRALSPPQIQLQHSGSILLRAYSRQVHPQ